MVLDFIIIGAKNDLAEFKLRIEETLLKNLSMSTPLGHNINFGRYFTQIDNNQET